MSGYGLVSDYRSLSQRVSKLGRAVTAKLILIFYFSTTQNETAVKEHGARGRRELRKTMT